MTIKMPQAWSTQAPSTTKTKATANVVTKAGVVDMSEEVAGKGLCPVCKEPMEQAIADGHHVRVCMDHRVALPLSDAEIEEIEAEKAKPINNLTFE